MATWKKVVVSGSAVTQLDFTDSTVLSGSMENNLPSGVVSSSAQTIANLPAGTVSGSVQVDGSSITTNTISLGGVSVALGGTDATPAFDLSDATAYPGDSSLTTLGTVTSGDVSAILPSGTVSGSDQISGLLPTGLISASLQGAQGITKFNGVDVTTGITLNGQPQLSAIDLVEVGGTSLGTIEPKEFRSQETMGYGLGFVLLDQGMDIVSSSAQVLGGSGVISSSAQVVASTYTNGETLTLNSSSNSTRITALEGSAGAPAGTISSSAAGTAQGTIALNGVDVNVKDMQITDTPHFVGVEIGNASDTTITRVSAGVIAVENNTILRADNDNIVSSSVQIDGASITTNTVGFGGVSVALGGTDATPAFDLSDATAYPGDSSLTTLGTVTSGDVSAILPAGTISSSGAGTNQGQFKLNGVDVTVKDLQTTSNPEFTNLTVSGDLEVAGTASFKNSTNLNVADQYISMNSGSAGAGLDSGGIVVLQDGAAGELFGWADASSDQRWGVLTNFNPSSTGDFAPEAYMSAVLKPAAANTTTTIAAINATYNKEGNLYTSTADDSIWIYS